MATKTKEVRLGQEVYLLSREGEVVRTVVAKINSNGSYWFLNGFSRHTRHWFTFKKAVLAADERTKALQKSLRRQLLALAKKRVELPTGAYKESVLGAPLKVVNLFGSETSKRTRYVKKVCVPEEYLKPGQCVYAIITPKTRPNEFVYRPHDYFVLETKVTSVGFTPDGSVRYSFDTPFVLEEFFTSREGAVEKLRGSFSLDEQKSSHFVSHEEEITERAKIDDIPF